MPSVIIDGKEITVNPGEKILWAALNSGVYIPHLCAIQEADLSFGGCRLCFVEVEVDGKREMVTACSEPIKTGMKIYTDTEKINRMRRTAFELIMSDHEIDCQRCAKRKECDLIKIASFLKMKLTPKRLRNLTHDFSIDDSHPLFTYDPKKCVKCGKCIWMCHHLGKSFLDFENRGFEMIPSTFDHIPLSLTGCESCLECVKICPTGALWLKEKGGPKDD
jgi:bidirectional [NiFe] hydrogenase diaphorase subunit